VTGRQRALLTRRHTPAVEAAFAEQFDVLLNPSDEPLSRDALVAALQECDVLVPTVSDRIDADVLTAHGAVRTRIIANVGVGFNHIDLRAAAAAGLLVSNTPDVLTDDTADLTMALILMAARRLGEGERLTRAGEFRGLAPTFLLGQSLRGRTLGIVGFGRIGQAVAQRATAFGLQIRWTGRAAAPHVADSRWCPSLEALLAECDIVSLHAPATPDTQHLINAERLSQMRPGSILINTARGSLVDESALATALRSGHLSAAGLDVHEREPLIAPELLALENVVLLPHLGSATVETRTAMGLRALENAVRWRDGLPLRDPIVGV
jgi:lactate dehydrogenase-like 2-hydroxyacid dehydrogenase